MKEKVIYYKIVLIFLFIFSFNSFLFGDIVQRCDSLIKKGLIEQDMKNYLKALELLTEARAIAESNNLQKQLFLSTNNIGISYSEMMDYGEALEYFLNAYTIAIKEMNTRNEMIALVNIAIIYSKKKKFDKAEDYFLRAFKNAKVLNDSVLIGSTAINLANLANETGKIQMAEEYIDIAYLLLQNKPREFAHIETTKLKNEYLKGNYEAAEKQAYSLLPKFADIEYKDSKISVLFTLSEIYLKTNELKKSIDIAYTILDEKPDIETRINVYEHLSKLFYNKGSYESAFLYRDSVDYAKDSLNIIKNEILFENNRIKFELLNYQKELENSLIRYNNQQKILVIIIISAGLLILFIILLLLNRKTIINRNRKIVELELEHEKNNKLLLENQLKEQEAVALLEQERLKNEQDKLKSELEAKNRELATKALYSSGKNELVENVIESLSELNTSADNDKLVNLIKRLKIKQKEDTEKDNFLSHFENINNEFLSSLKEKHPHLTANEIRFLSYIYINLSTKEISSLLNITVETCKKKRKRVCQKMGLNGSSSLYRYLSEI